MTQQIKDILGEMAEGVVLFERNSLLTRMNFKIDLSTRLNGIVNQPFSIICDETNNTAEVIDRNEFKARLLIGYPVIDTYEITLSIA